MTSTMIKRVTLIVHQFDPPVHVESVVCVEGELAMIAVGSSENAIDCEALRGRFPDLDESLRAELNVPEIILVGFHPEPMQFLRNVFSPLDVKNVTLEYDPICEATVAKIVVDKGQLGVALGDNGNRARLAAMITGQDLEVVTQ